MSDTANLSLPLLQPAQAQKHVTVNEALARLDGLTQLCLQSVSQAAPPVSPADGAAYGVPQGAVNAWAGKGGNVAVFVAGGWVFVAARRGWRAMVLDDGHVAVFDGTLWRAGAVTLSPGGASLAMRAAEIDVTLGAGASVATPVAFPERAIAFGVTGRVTAAISGTATAWALGVEGDAARYGTGLGLSQNAWVNGPGVPIVYWAATPLLVTPIGGEFAGGTLRLVAHFAELSLPDAV
ncbi:DUF2793 domain-containing protein [Roseibacterium sp. SDUM158017]|uniref:DUF2793 domain-containing protein n=1 Tax=Roseicyclus salinarum TaxID=3036773 RepID=UPI002414DCFC|nr:DUF2793 domain-containing protein [Roseibacterium sp. SDUM158017]MDG4649812.1 DUF2793 domain-containing protein [Roseibacterium sp. SDUM158017]